MNFIFGWPFRPFFRCDIYGLQGVFHFPTVTSPCHAIQLRPSSQLEKLRWAIKWAKDDVDLVLGGGKSRCGVSQLAIWKGTETQKRKLKKSSKRAFSGASLNFGCVCRLILGNDWVLLVSVVFCVLDGRQNFLHQILLLPPSSTLESIISWVTR